MAKRADGGDALQLGLVHLQQAMLAGTHTEVAPWTCVRANGKKKAHKAMIRHLLRALGSAEVAKDVEAPDAKVLFGYEAAAIEDGRLKH